MLKVAMNSVLGWTKALRLESTAVVLWLYCWPWLDQGNSARCRRAPGPHWRVPRGLVLASSRFPAAAVMPARWPAPPQFRIQRENRK
jgi:hypothetical protein